MLIVVTKIKIQQSSFKTKGQSLNQQYILVYLPIQVKFLERLTLEIQMNNLSKMVLAQQKLFLYKQMFNDYFWTLLQNGEVTFFGQKMSGSSNYFINLYDESKGYQNNIVTVDTNCIEQMIKILEEHNYKNYLLTIQDLEPFYITLLAENNSLYIIKINPSQYTKEIIYGFYQLTNQTTKQDDIAWQLSIDIQIPISWDKIQKLKMSLQQRGLMIQILKKFLKMKKISLNNI
ncbi:hypothetical protein ABPG74_014039 [Tetrahymena malaccensis]